MKIVTAMYKVFDYDELSPSTKISVREMFAQYEHESGDAAHEALAQAIAALAKIGVSINIGEVTYDLTMHTGWPWVAVPFSVSAATIMLVPQGAVADANMSAIVRPFQEMVREINQGGVDTWFHNETIPFVVDDDGETTHVNLEWALIIKRSWFPAMSKIQKLFMDSMQELCDGVINYLLESMQAAEQAAESDEYARKESAEEGLMYFSDGRLLDTRGAYKVVIEGE